MHEPDAPSPVHAPARRLRRRRRRRREDDRALETLERARGHLLSFHQLIGATDLALDQVVDLLRDADQDELARTVETDLLGRNVLDGRWTFQVVDGFEDGYWQSFRDHERAVRDALTGGRRHVFEAEMKERRRTHGRPGHEARPAR